MFTPQRKTPFCLMASRVGPAEALRGASAGRTKAEAIASFLIQLGVMGISTMELNGRSSVSETAERNESTANLAGGTTKPAATIRT